MKSRITIEVDFDNGQPYIKVMEDAHSDDVRDKLITFFRQRLGHASWWCYIGFYGDGNENGMQKWTIHPITPEKLPEMKKYIDAQVENPIPNPAT